MNPARATWRDSARWIAYAALAMSLAAAVVLRGGVDPGQWQWLVLVIAAGSIACVALRSRSLSRAIALEERLLFALLAWMLLALVPLPVRLIEAISPARATLAVATGALAPSHGSGWIPLSAAPPATLERLLFVLPAMALFVAAREMPAWWRGRRAWIGVAPLIVVATLEGLLGTLQFATASDGMAGPHLATGTYVNRNHFAGLLELAFPLTVGWIAALWIRQRREARGASGAAVLLCSAALALAAGCMLAGVIASGSRMGFGATLTALAIVLSGSLLVTTGARRRSFWPWLVPFAVVAGIVLFGSTDVMVLRLGTLLDDGATAGGRVPLWRETWTLWRTYPWTGAGLGTFEHAVYPFRQWMPVNAVEFAHNDFLQILSELGGVGFALTMALAVCIAQRAIRVSLAAGSGAPLGLAVIASLAAASLHSLVDFNLYVPANALAMAWLAGVATSPALRDVRA